MLNHKLKDSYLMRGFRRVVLLAIFLTALGTFPSEAASEKPIKAVTITMDRNSLSDFLDSLRILADRNAFAIRIGQSSPDPEDVLVQMWREDLKVIGFKSIDSTADETKFFIGIYNNNCDHPVPVEASDALISEIRTATAAIPGASLMQKE